MLPPSEPPSRSATWTAGVPLAFVGIAVLVASVLAFAGEWWWVLDAVANFRIQLSIMGTGVVIGALALRLRSLVVLGLAIVAVNVVPIVPLFAGGAGASVDRDLRIASYNVRAGAAENARQAVAWLATTDADIVFLHEATSRWRRLVERADLPWTIVGPEFENGEPFGTMALVPEGSEVRFEEVIRRATPAVTVEVDGEVVTVLGVHALSPYGSARSEARDRELLALGEWAAGQDERVIVAGDFNATPFSWSFQRLLEVGNLENSLEGFGLQPTWPSGNIFLRIPIDHLVHTDGIAVVDRRVADSFGSDHLPLIVDLAVVPRGAVAGSG